ncbi:hypothetical protein WISP_86349 [Willisornis vidua]|uniref:Reverse transcriptase domain-containing protein n=1 Tax=Willisornis vidua TaxID=1566151 RepID=A0ABQ9D2X9_9PASS|nr:hypothetical protein WISP_86349 [Willisornis vidua]
MKKRLSKVTCLVAKGKAVDVYLDFSKAYDIVSNSIVLNKLTAHRLDRSPHLEMVTVENTRPSSHIAFLTLLQPANRSHRMTLAPLAYSHCAGF